jgi:phospholipid/cholesterol/gamma-HCH transport system substrate-binding protein
VKSFRERNTLIIGAISLALIAIVTVGALNYQRLPFISDGNTYSAYFEEAGALETGAPVQVSGFRAGRVKSISLTPQGVLITFTVADNIRLGERTEATIKSTTLLGNKVLEVSPRGPGQLSSAIPTNRTTSPYQLPDAIAISPRQSADWTPTSFPRRYKRCRPPCRTLRHS